MKPLFERDDLREILRALPAQAGVYLMKDRHGQIIYVGKAQVLRDRVRSYFNASGDSRPAVEFLRQRIFDLETVVTANAKAALLLENTLIKKHRPRYNIDLRDDKTYLGLRLTTQDRFPRLATTRRPAKDGSEYFGPFSSSASLYEVLRLIQKVFGLRVCNDTFFRNRARPCIEHQIGRCLAPCIEGMVDDKAYAQAVAQARRFLRGQGDEVVARLEGLMQAASHQEQFELAIKYRDQIEAVRATLERQAVVSHRRDDDWDVFGLHVEEGFAELCVLLVRGGQVVGSESYPIRHALEEPHNLLAEIISQRYLRAEGKPAPAEILLPFEVSDQALLEDLLSETHSDGKRVEILVPKRGEKRRLIEMAQENAAAGFSQAKRRQERRQAGLDELTRKLHLAKIPERIECYDISNIHGRQAVGSRVVFIDGESDKRFYRHFKIKTVEGSNDFQMLHEVLSRRFKSNTDEARPDLLIVDGGKGQLSMAVAVINELGLEGIVLAGMAKARVLPDAKGRSEERIFLPGRSNPVTFRPGSPALFLLQRLRDEAHRFAITHHRKLRHKATLRTALEEVAGVGPERARKLLELFGSVERVAAATPQELQAAGLSEELARRVSEQVQSLKGFSQTKA